MNPNQVPNNNNRNPNINMNQKPVYMPFSQLTGQNTNNYPMSFSNQNHNQNQRQQQIDPKFQEVRNQKIKNAMYSSTMEFNKPVFKNFASLESMGRFVPQNDKIEVTEEPKMRQQQFQQNSFDNRYKKTQMASSTIFTNEGTKQLDRFPMFDLHASKKTPVAKVEAQINPLITKEQTSEQKRKKQLEEIRKQFEQITKKVDQMNIKPKSFGQVKSGNPVQQKIGGGSFPSFLKKAPEVSLETKSQFTAIQINNQFQPFAGKSRDNKQATKIVQMSFKKPIQKVQEKPVKKVQLAAEIKYQDFYVYSNQEIRKPMYVKQQQLMSSSSTYSSQSDRLQKEEMIQMVFKKKTGALTIEDLYAQKTAQKYQKVKVQLIEKKPLVKFQKSDFVTVKKLGKGQFGQVTLVVHKLTGFLCGLKVMEKKQIRQQKYVNQISRQLSIQFFLAHRNIASLYGYFQDTENFYLLVEFCPDGQLLQKLRKERRMQEQDVSVIIRQILQGMNHIHKQYIIHRDIKPENILFSYDVVKICDFGWAVYAGQGMRKTASGSPLYYSPEIVNGDEYNQKIDIWDIGMMVYECLLGKIPFKIYSQMDLKRIVTDQVQFPDYVDVTEEAKDFILRTLKKKPEDRMQIRQMLRHPFIAKYKDKKLPIEVMEDLTKALS